MKKEFRCKQCGRMFVTYAYAKFARCEECRRSNFLAVKRQPVKGPPGKIAGGHFMIADQA